ALRAKSAALTNQKKFKEVVTLATLRQTAGLEDMLVLKKGMRLSIQPVTEKEFKIIEKMGSK
ncbi:MAG TPA: EVE domain-containing protein, partial [Leptospiraceae bacterium]|nr:EVE domain-containing protein [Leptospiraceae bacterium]